MASNFKIFPFETRDSLHLKLDGDFDGNSAHELLNTLKKHGDGFYQIFIDTEDLKTIHPFGKEVFQKNLGAFKNQSHDIIFFGRNENEFKAYQKHDLRNGLLIMGAVLSILFTIAVIPAILALCRWLILYGVGENHYPDIKDL